jgi:chromosomal replication initiator protein
MSEAASRLWSKVSSELRSALPEHRFNVWFGNARPRHLDSERFVLAVSNRFIKEWIDKQYRAHLERAVAAALGGYVAIEIAIDRSLSRAASDGDGERPGGGPGTQGALFAWLGRSEPEGVPLRDEHTFANFVVGPCNRMSHAAAVAVAESPGTAYNPFFVHGGVGLGKTHLLQAICHEVIARRPEAKILFLPSDTFVNHFISAVEKHDVEGFRTRYRHLDVLVLDDIQFLRGKERTQEEFFHTFNALHNAHKQIVLSSDTPPRGIPDVEERLVSRFKWGLVTRLDMPQLETRMAIVKSMARPRGVDVPEDVVALVAERITTNIRELEGGLTRLLAYASLTGRDVSVQVAEEALKGIEVAPPLTPVTIERIQAVVVSRFGVKPAELRGPRRTKSIVYPRQLCMYLARRLTGDSLEDIGTHFGGRDHTTVLHAVEKIEQLVGDDPTTRDLVDSIEQEVTAPV